MSLIFITAILAEFIIAIIICIIGIMPFYYLLRKKIKARYAILIALLRFVANLILTVCLSLLCYGYLRMENYVVLYLFEFCIAIILELSSYLISNYCIYKSLEDIDKTE